MLLPQVATVPSPYNAAQTYQAQAGMVRGTLYPGLDLPFMGMVNQKEKSRTPMHQLQALNFAITELGLYLDTHSSDDDATALFDQYVEQYAEVLRQYEKSFGATTQMGAALTGEYEWLKDPWPWEFSANQEG